MNLKQIEIQIPNLTGILVIIIAICAFVLSFFNLQSTAIDAGINPWLSWMWPICSDSLMIAASGMILRSSLRKESTIIGWSVLIVFTLISMTFNVIHSPPDWVSRSAHALPSLALMISVEMFMIIVRSDLDKTDDGHLLKCVEPVNAGQVVGFCASDDFPKTENVEIMAKTKPRKKTDAQLIVEGYFRQNPKSNVTEASRTLRMSRTTVTKYKPHAYDQDGE